MRFAASLVFLFSCADTPTTGAICPTVGAPSYASFGQRFLTTYCTGCHSQHATDRHGAPRGLDFDSEAEIRRNARAIEAEAAAGPDADFTDMPDMTGPVKVPPTLDERRTLGEFLACEERTR